MRRRWLLPLSVPAALALWWAWPARPLPAPGAARPARTPAPVAVLRSATPAIVDEAPEPRQAVVRDLPAEGTIGRLVQGAMAKPGDSDPRLLDLLDVVGASPSALATLGAAIDPWLAVGLVDLERQVARRCSLRHTPDACWETALAAEDDVAAVLEDPDAAAALRRFRGADGASAQ